MDPTTPSAPPADRTVIAPGRRRVLARTPSFVVGAAIWLFWLACTIAPGVFTNRDDQGHGLEGPLLLRSSPRPDAWFGTDSVGRDVYARVIHGADDTVVAALCAAAIAVVLGTGVGLIMGTRVGWGDEILSRTLEVVVSLPALLLAILATTVYGRSRLVLVLTIAGLSTPLVAKTVRSAVLGQTRANGAARSSPGGRAGGHRGWPEIDREMSRLLAFEFTERVRYAILTVATLSFLGLGSGAPEQADWGRDLASSYALLQAGQWWTAVFPALAITSLLLATNLIGPSPSTQPRCRSSRRSTHHHEGPAS